MPQQCTSGALYHQDKVYQTTNQESGTLEGSTSQQMAVSSTHVNKPSLIPFDPYMDPKAQFLPTNITHIEDPSPTFPPGFDPQVSNLEPSLLPNSETHLDNKANLIQLSFHSTLSQPPSPQSQSKNLNTSLPSQDIIPQNAQDETSNLIPTRKRKGSKQDPVKLAKRAKFTVHTLEAVCYDPKSVTFTSNARVDQFCL